MLPSFTVVVNCRCTVVQMQQAAGPQPTMLQPPQIMPSLARCTVDQSMVSNKDPNKLFQCVAASSTYVQAQVRL